MRIVLDTDVLVSGLLNPFGAPGHIVRMVASGKVTLAFDARVLAEYGEVLGRPRFGFDPDAVGSLLEYIEFTGLAVASEPLSVRLPDPDDEQFLEVAVASRVACLVTGNVAHFPPACCTHVDVLTPAELVEAFRERERSP